jgi:antitoxin VapB
MTARKTRTFKSGNSVALRLPKALGVEAGIEMTVREECGRYIVEPAERKPKTIDLTGIEGAAPWLKPHERYDFDDLPREWDLLGDGSPGGGH